MKKLTKNWTGSILSPPGRKAPCTSALQKEKAFYAENYPGLIVEKGGIDDLITMMTGR